MDNVMFVNILVYIYISIGVWVGGGSIYMYYYILTHIQHYDIWVYTSIYGQGVKFDEALDRRFSQEMGQLSSIPWYFHDRLKPPAMIGAMNVEAKPIKVHGRLSIAVCIWMDDWVSDTLEFEGNSFVICKTKAQMQGEW